MRSLASAAVRRAPAKTQVGRVEVVKLKGLDRKKKFTPSQNEFGVPAKKWRQWCPYARRMFNDLYRVMIDNQYVFTHPKTPQVSDRQWSTTCWNTAWIAADNAQHALENYEE